MKLKNIIKLLIGVVLILVITLTIILINRDTTKLLYQEGQIGLITKEKEVKISNQVYKPYKTTKNSIKISFETFNINDDYNNEMIINNEYIFPINPKENRVNEFILNEVSVLGLNIIDGNLKIAFKIGENNNGKTDSFWIRNTTITVNNNIIKPIEEQGELIVVTRLGRPGMKEPLRVDYQEEVVLNFKVDDKLLKDYGFLLKENTEKITLIKNNKEKVLINPAYLKIETNINNNDSINKTTILNILFSSSKINYQILLNGIEINNGHIFHQEAWAVGNHELEITAVNEYGFVETKKINFTLNNNNIQLEELNFTAYEYGVEKLLNSAITNGKEINNITNHESKFNEESAIYFEVENSSNKNIIWEGSSIKNRTIYMQAYNFKTNEWTTKSSVNYFEDDVILGFNYEDQDDYIKDNKLNIRIISENITTKRLIDTYIYHMTDLQYISRNGTIEIETISNIAKNALNEMAEYVIESFDDGVLDYVIMTGDFVQSTVVSGEEEWTIIMDHLLNPMLENNVPFGAVSGNHDIGALIENTNEGSDALDEFLIYDLWYENLGANVFEEFDYYGGSFENNRSHYDLITINNHEFLFLYLGWGSSIKGIHVSEKDINWAKTVLELYPNKTVIIGVHEYMSHSEQRSRTGNFVFDELVVKYSNIKFVFSGHINGSSSKLDIIDDNNDGVGDRRVLQLLTNFQEEEINNLGATFIRRIGLDFTNNRLSFDLYSPVANDNKIFVAQRGEIVKKNSDFNYDFDLNNNGYGLKTIRFGM